MFSKKKSDVHRKGVDNQPRVGKEQVRDCLNKMTVFKSTDKMRFQNNQ